MKPIISFIFTYFFIQCSFSLKIKSDKSNTLFLTNNKNIKDNNKIRIINDYKDFLLSASTFNSIDASITFSTLTNSLRFYNSTNPNIQNDEKIIAVAHYNASLDKIGWSKLYIQTNPEVDESILSYSAGYLEGVLTCHQILNFYNNLYNIHVNEEEKYLQKVLNFFSQIQEHIKYKTSKQYISSLKTKKEQEYWTSLSIIQSQTNGLMDGYNEIMTNNPLNLAQFYFINADGEIPELISVFRAKEKENYYSFKENSKINEKFSREYLKYYFGTGDPEQVWTNLMKKSHCSAVIKQTKDDIIVSHTTWDSFSEMDRIIKVYNFTSKSTNKEADKNFKNLLLSFSSYAGTLTSTDDFYILNNQMVILETSLETLDKSLYNKIEKPEDYVPNYIRIFISNYLARNPKEWCEIFKEHNSGTYSSQWMIVDYKSGSFFVLEQMPGNIIYEDKSNYLLYHGSWMSFNRPYFKEMSKLSGYDEMFKKYGRTYSYKMNPRARILDMLLEGAEKTEDFKKIMRYNLSENKKDFVATISPRYDLAANIIDRRPSGGIDAKITNKAMALNGEFFGISGPSNENGAEVFDWSKFIKEPHDGLPLRWDFDWVTFNYEYIKN